MSVAWTTVLIVLLLLPGLFFFVGLARLEPLPREIIRSSVISEIGLAACIAIAIHLILISILSAAGFRLSAFIQPFFEYGLAPTSQAAKAVSGRLGHLAIYVIVSGVCGVLMGYAFARAMMAGYFRVLATHKWIYDVLNENRKGRVATAYVVTTTTHEDKVLMYRGAVKEFFLTAGGTLAYVVLQNCSRFYMTFADTSPQTTQQLRLGESQGSRLSNWAYLMIEGENIANILFELSPKIIETKAGNAALESALNQLESGGS
jgi:hypothetical protein